MAYQKVSREQALPDTELSQAAFEGLDDRDLASEADDTVLSDSAALIREGAAAVRTIRTSQRSLSSKLGPLAR